MYMDKQVKRGYNEYIRLDEGIGKDAHDGRCSPRDGRRRHLELRGA